MARAEAITQAGGIPAQLRLGTSRARAQAIFFLGAVGTLVAVALVFLQLGRRSAIAEREATLSTLGSALAQVVESPLREGDFPTTDDELQRQSFPAFIRSITIKDADGNIVASTRETARRDSTESCGVLWSARTLSRSFPIGISRAGVLAPEVGLGPSLEIQYSHCDLNRRAWLGLETAFAAIALLFVLGMRLRV